MRQMISVSELHSIPEYEAIRFDMRRHAVALRKFRRVPVGERVTFVFENRDTMLFQIHEMIRTEGVTDPVLLQAECEVYNSLLPDRNELSATMFVQPPRAPNVRAELDRLAGVDERTWIVLGGEVIPAQVDRGQSAEERIATVQYVRFQFTDEQRARARDPGTPMLIRIDHPNYKAEARIEGQRRLSICEDLA